MLIINNAQKKNKSEVINLIDIHKKPVLFWDTCSLLDIVRLPLPDRNNKVDTLSKVIEIKDKIVSNDIISLSSELCITEFNNHIENWSKRLESESKKLSKSHNKFIGFINKVNLTSQTISDIDLSIYKIEELLCQITHAIISNTIFVEEDDTFKEFAHFRTMNKIPPAQKKGEYKDCYIWATCLEIRNTNTDKSYPYYFISSNVSDYANENKKEFVTEISNEATINNIEYFSNFKIAFGILKSKNIV
ncbi:hypothetical protein ESY86_18550 [Subsaximicrobium wynnwilliamsii]|uniref:DUF4935 domain-containing protein n=2 Tax=Subsaximicrobium wynnwilliamsii TaxID=291179 RepID=A0A5C6ZBK7_9FLAO|nr:hypothetical protein ESY87_19050 [Subsaximicrobium wynnwilliamsii]TXD86993.1 hypothetical protein ESY86_18550 [Subsaximicrobium wynnwilliamsii]TXE00646.1 hypothetical protein ESY88_18850 [Subsaximicrobium wynnwilliamsii]